MHILFVSNYFPPEVNAPATRLYEHAKHWVKEGHTVDVLTSVPNFPEGVVYDGYKNRFLTESTDGINVYRVPMYVTANEGVTKRALSYLSFMGSAIWYARHLPTPDITIATSPQFFAGLGGYAIARLKGAPFVLEIRDLWPESIVAVGAMERNAIIRGLEHVEEFLYRQSEHIVVVTESFKEAIVDKGISPDAITVIKNGVDLHQWNQPLDQEKLGRMRERLGLEGKFVASYIGTIGMAHRADVLLEAAQRCSAPAVVFMVVGTGAQREALEARQRELQLDNFRLVDKVPKEEVPYLLALTDASVIHLRKSPLFETVIPSKIFEAMATRTPIILGVQGEAKALIEEANAGIPMTPEDPDALIDAVHQLKSDENLRDVLANDAYQYVKMHYTRERLAHTYTERLHDVLASST